MTYKAPSPNFLKNSPGTDSSIIRSELVKIDTELNAGLKIIKGSLSPGNANAFALVQQNPETSKILIDKIVIRLTTAGGTATSVIDVGIVADATSTADTLIDGLDLNTTGVFDNVSSKGTNGKTVGIVDEKGGTNDYITGKILVANAASLAGKYYIFYTVI